MASVIIDGKNTKGVRVSASMDEFLWKLVCADFKSPADARAWVRECMAELQATKGITSIVRDRCLERIVKPSLLKRVWGLEAQMDIEEV